MICLIKIVKKWPKKGGHETDIITLQRSIDARFKQWMNFETCTCQKYTESVQIQWIKKNNYINKGNVSSLMKIVKTADDSYVGLLRLSQTQNFINGKWSTYQKKHQTICRWWS